MSVSPSIILPYFQSKRTMKRTTILILFTFLAFICCQAQTAQQADSLHQRGRDLLNESKFAEARECFSQAMTIRKQLFGEVNEDYINSLNNCALTYGGEQNYAKGVEVLEKVMALCAQLTPPHKNIGMFTTNMGRFYFLAGDMTKAAQAWERAMPLVEKFGEEYELILTGLSIIYEEAKDTDNFYRIMALMEEHNQHELTKPCDDPMCMVERARYYVATGNNAMAKECYQKALDMNMDDETRVALYEQFALFLTLDMEDKEAGAEYQNTAAALRKKIHGEDKAYADAIFKAGQFYSLAMTQSYWQKAIDCYQQALPIYERLNDAANVAKCKQKEGSAYNGLEDYAKSKTCYMEAIAYYEANDKESEEYPRLIERLAYAEKKCEEYDASISHYRQAMQIYEQRGMMEDYASAENGLKLCYLYAGKDMSEASDGSHDEAISATRAERARQMIASEKEGLEYTKKYLGKKTYAHSLNVIAGNHLDLGDYQEAVDYYRQYMDNVREAIREEFRLQSEAERMLTWEGETETMRQLKELVADLPDEHKSLAGEVAALAYDAELLSKGILLNSAIEFEKLLNESTDKQLTEIYRKTKANREEIERLRKTAKSETDLQRLLTLTQENQKLQTQLNNGCKEMDDFTHYISYDWKDVQAAMTDNDVCIEFATLGLGIGATASHMIALVLTKDMARPVAVTLWDNHHAHDIFDTPFYPAIRDSLLQTLPGLEKGKNGATLIKDLREQLDATETPLKAELSLFLHLLENDKDTLSLYMKQAKYDMEFAVSLMGYEQLIQQDENIFVGPEVGEIIWGRLSPYLQDKKRVFFSADGMFNNLAIEYLPYQGKPFSEQMEVYRLSSTKELCYRHEHAKPTKAVLFGDINYNDVATHSDDTQRALATLRGSGDGFADLGNTLREINTILAILKDNSVEDAYRLRDTEASKEAFMGLTGSGVNLIHLATHGLFKDVQESTDAESMNNSLLAFAGANTDDSALLSAAEIAAMNLRQCDLAVLSACESGLGKLGGDGVFGLQRGFKNAGVHTLLMSLRKVDDRATADLMVSFYKHLMGGASKREALVKAQQEIRQNGFSDPKYWAVFILLDGM